MRCYVDGDDGLLLTFLAVVVVPLLAPVCFDNWLVVRVIVLLVVIFLLPYSGSISIPFLGASLAAGLSLYYYFSGYIYKQADCLGKLLGFAEKGSMREIGDFNGAISEYL